MKNTTNLLLCILTVFLTSAILADLFADTPLPPPKVRQVWSHNKQFYALMDPKVMTTTVYRVEDGAKRAKSWTMPGWFRVAHLADDGEHFVVGHDGINLLPLKVTKDEPLIRFFERGKLVNTVTLGELLKDQSSLKRTASHYLWGSYLGLDEKGHYVVKTVEGRTLVFDVTTGKPVMPAEDSSEAEKQALAAAESWLALVDDGKYAESWDVAAEYLKTAVSFENKKSAVETITPMLDKDKKWRVSGYYIK